VVQSPRLFLAVRCGSIGQRGNGGHAHNDQLHVELVIDGVPCTTDPGTYVYTPLPERRNEYRSVRAHFAPSRARGGEPSDLSVGLFYLGDDPRAEVLAFGRQGFIGTHRGFGAPIYRVVEIDRSGVRIVDHFHEALVRLPWPESGKAVGPAPGPAVAFSPGYGLIAR
jgi:hypothetical protein